MSNKYFLDPNKIKLFIAEQDNTIVKNRTWSQHVSLYLNELIRRTFQEDDSIPQDVSVSLVVITTRILQQPEELTALKEKVKDWDPEAITVYILKEPVSAFQEKGYVVRLYSIDQESNLVFSEEEIFEKGKIQHFLARISDVLYSVAGILTDRTTPDKEGVYLAESDDSQEALRQNIRKDLMRSGYYVFPDRNCDEEHLEAKLNCAILSIHFFGRNLESKRNVFGELSSHFDNKEAVKIVKQRNDARRFQPSIKPLRRIIWIPDSGVAKNEKQENFIADLRKNPTLNEGAEFYWGSTEVLKEAIQEALRSQVTNRVQDVKRVQLQQMVARKENQLRYAENRETSEADFRTDNPGNPDSNAETHAQEDARHHNLMHWLRPEDEFRPNQGSDSDNAEKKIITEEMISSTEMIVTEEIITTDKTESNEEVIVVETNTIHVMEVVSLNSTESDSNEPSLEDQTL